MEKYLVVYFLKGFEMIACECHQNKISGNKKYIWSYGFGISVAEFKLTIAMPKLIGEEILATLVWSCAHHLFWIELFPLPGVK